jgi:hypothetical protein
MAKHCRNDSKRMPKRRPSKQLSTIRNYFPSNGGLQFCIYLGRMDRVESTLSSEVYGSRCRKRILQVQQQPARDTFPWPHPVHSTTLSCASFSRGAPMLQACGILPALTVLGADASNIQMAAVTCLKDKVVYHHFHDIGRAEPHGCYGPFLIPQSNANFELHRWRAATIVEMVNAQGLPRRKSHRHDPV